MVKLIFSVGGLIKFLFSAVFLPVFSFSFYSCGIKASPKPLPEPSVEIKRIWDNVFVIPKEGKIEVKGFAEEGGWFYKREAKAFCFEVRRIEGKRQKYCVQEAVLTKPLVSIEEGEEVATLNLSGFDAYMLYPIKDNKLSLSEGKEIKSMHTISKDYWERCYAITGIKGSQESEPYTFCLKPKAPPPIRDVERLEYRVVGDRIYLFWSYTPDELFEEFVIHKNGELLGSTKSYIYEDTLPKAKTTYTVKVRSKLGFESEGSSISYSP